MNRAYIGLGTNIEPRANYLHQAIEELRKHDAISITKQSSIYETAPVGYVNQANFLNMVLEIETTFSPLALLERCQKIEKNLGRKRTIRFGPRTIDLDILMYNDENIKTERLIIPHPRMHERAFVLVPFVEIAPNVTHVISHKRVEKLLNNLATHERAGVKQWEGNR